MIHFLLWKTGASIPTPKGRNEIREEESFLILVSSTGREEWKQLLLIIIATQQSGCHSNPGNNQSMRHEVILAW